MENLCFKSYLIVIDNGDITHGRDEYGYKKEDGHELSSWKMVCRAV
jgi:hypothetical protein